jgi:hypothetical protein
MHSRARAGDRLYAYLFVEPISDENVNFGVLSECGATGGTSLVRHVEQTAGAEGVPTCDGHGLVEYIYSRVRTGAATIVQWRGCTYRDRWRTGRPGSSPGVQHR